MTTIDSVEAASDLDLLTLARSGRPDAVAELWRRHYGAALRAARRWSANAYDAEDAASEAFSRMLVAVAGGRGPTGSVGGYLAVSVRNIAANRARRHEQGDLRTPNPELYARPQGTRANPVANQAELGLVREAFASLPTRWRVVLWRTAVDRDTNRALAQEMGITANAVAALAVRARGGFRAAYLQAHVSRGRVDPSCQPFLVLLPALASGGRPSAALADHLLACARCHERADELSEVERHLRVMTLPVVMGVGWDTLRGLAPPRVEEVRALVLARPRGLLLAGVGGIATAAIVGIAAVDQDPGPAPSMAAPRPSSTAPVIPDPVMPSESPPPVPSPPPPVVMVPPPPAPSPPPPVVTVPPPVRAAPSPSAPPPLEATALRQTLPSDDEPDDDEHDDDEPHDDEPDDDELNHDEPNDTIVSLAQIANGPAQRDHKRNNGLGHGHGHDQHHDPEHGSDGDRERGQ